MTNRKRLAPDKMPTKIGNHGAAAKVLSFTKLSFKAIDLTAGLSEPLNPAWLQSFGMLWRSSNNPRTSLVNYPSNISLPRFPAVAANTPPSLHWPRELLRKSSRLRMNGSNADGLQTLPASHEKTLLVSSTTTLSAWRLLYYPTLKLCC